MAYMGKNKKEILKKKKDKSKEKTSEKILERKVKRMSARSIKKKKTIDDMFDEIQGEEYDIGILTQDQIKRFYSLVIAGKVMDGLTEMPPTTQERLKACDSLANLQKSDINDNAVDEHNQSILEFELKNKGENPDRKLEDFEE